MGPVVAVLALVLTACSFPPSSTPTPCDWNLDYDEVSRDSDVSAIFTVSDGLQSKALSATAKAGDRNGKLDSIELKLLDESGSDLEAALAGLPADNGWRLFKVGGAGPFAAAGLGAWLWSSLGHWSPRIALIELSQNSYGAEPWIISESISRGDLRIPLKKLEASDADTWSIEGGYIYHLENLRLMDELNGDFLAESRLIGHISYPNRPTVLQRNYLSAFHNGFEEACILSPETLPNRSISDYADIPAFVDWTIVQELAMQEPLVDMDIRFSKERGGKILPCAAEEYRSAFNGADTSDALMTTVLPWIAGLWRDPEFLAQLHERWAAMRAGKFSDANLRSKVREEGALFLAGFDDAKGYGDLALLEASIIRRAAVLDTLFDPANGLVP